MTDLDKLIAAVEAGRSPTVKQAIAAIPQWSSMVLAAYDGSLDAAKALHDALLPGWWWHSMSNNGVSLSGPWVDNCDDPDASGYRYQDAEIKQNPARAWLLAILKAYRVQQRKTK